VVVFAASAVVGLQLGVWWKFALVAGFAMAAMLTLYELLVRRWAPARFLLGMKPLHRHRADRPFDGPSDRPGRGPRALSPESGAAYVEASKEVRA
jgi:hypothetical protein